MKSESVLQCAECLLPIDSTDGVSLVCFKVPGTGDCNPAKQSVSYRVPCYSSVARLVDGLSERNRSPDERSDIRGRLMKEIRMSLRSSGLR